MNEGIHHMTLAEYVNDPCPEPSLNASLAHTILTQTALHAREQHPRLNPQKEREETERLDIGTIAHALLLEDDRSKVVVIDADDWRKKETKEQRDEARSAGLQPILRKDYDGVEEMVIAAKRQIANTEFAMDFVEAVPEQTLIWKDEGIWCRCRPDKATKDWRVEFDYKTCAGSASPLLWDKTVLRYGYDLQCALNLRAVKHLKLAKKTTFVFIVQELEKPYALSMMSLAPAWLTLGSDKLRIAMSIWKGCLRTNEWPGYPSRVAYLEPPAYAMGEWDAALPPISAEDFI